jgi:hypothetical protein
MTKDLLELVDVPSRALQVLSTDGASLARTARAVGISARSEASRRRAMKGRNAR